MRNAGTAGQCTRIGPTDAGLWFMLAELWRQRHLLYVFVWRDVKVRYKQTMIGAAWTIFQPLLTMLVFTLVFDRLAKVSSGNIPYPLFVYCGLLPWQFFSQGLLRSGNSLVDNRYLITKVYLPPMVLPIAAILSGVPDFAASLAVLFGLMLYYGFAPGISALAVVPLLAFTAIVALAFGLFLSALNVRYRDVGYTIPFFAQLWFFLTPIAYPSPLIPERWRAWYALNPMTIVAEGVRWALIGTTANIQHTARAVIAVSVLLALGIVYFNRAQRRFADVV
jgi:lipopolysaccharide transport system permease protein